MEENHITVALQPNLTTDDPGLLQYQIRAQVAHNLDFSRRPEEKSSILRARAQALAKEPLPNYATADTFYAVEFRLAHEHYALELAYVREIFPLKVLTPIPCTPPFVLGVVNLRGQIISVIDLKKLFDLPEQGLTDINCVLVLCTPHLEVGILTDAILGVRQIMPAQLHPPLPILTSLGKEVFKGVTSEGAIILAPERLLADKRIIVHEEIQS